MTQEEVKHMFNQKMSGVEPFSEFDLQTLKDNFINQDIKNATDEELKMIESVKWNLTTQKSIYLSSEIIWKCYLEYLFRLNNITPEKLYSRIVDSYSKLPKRQTKKVNLSEFEEFEEKCKNKNPDAKNAYHTLAKKYRDNQDKLKELNNIKNKYW